MLCYVMLCYVMLEFGVGEGVVDRGCDDDDDLLYAYASLS